MIQTIVTVGGIVLIALFSLIGFLHFSSMFLERHKELRLRIRSWLGWREISHAEYQTLLCALVGAPDYIHKDGCLDEGAMYREEDWDTGYPAQDTFTRLNSDVFRYQQKPRPETSVCLYRTTRRDRHGVHVELMKEGWMEPCNGTKLWSHLTDSPFEFLGPPVMVRFHNSGTLHLPTS